jgi:NADH-quinone oxidoreductase subunit F
MSRLASVEDLKSLRSIVSDHGDPNKPRIVVCAGTACQASGSSDIIRAAKKHIIQEDLLGKVSLRVTGCHGFCEMGPFILTEPQNAFYTQVLPESVSRIIDALVENKYVDDFLYKDPTTGKRYYNRDEIPFFKNQKRSILVLNENIDPIRIYDYIAQGGYGSLEKVLNRKDPGWVVEEVVKSGLRGRGGAGFSTGRKWRFLAKQPGDKGKFLVCNADEGDPGAYMDRSVLEGNPHSIIEGMIIGAYGTGAKQGIVYVRAEYPLAIKHLTIALRQAREHGLLGDNILGTEFSFDISIVRGAGAFVCGEETALIRSIEGKIGEPRQRPPFPIQKGVNGRPTAINNVETWANIPLIFKMGADQFAKIGTKGNSGTKIFSLVGKIKNTGLVEVPMGMTIGEIVFDIGGGPSGKAAIKAVQTGGPSGGCIPVKDFDLPIDYDSLAEAGSIMGSGGMIVMDENTCMVDVARYYMNFLKDESCGKCFPCRKGTQRMYEILDDVSKGVAALEDLDLLEELALVVKDSTMCGLGQTASNPVLSTLKYFKEEYRRHVVDKKCDALVCKDLTGAPCQAACPLGTEAWRYVTHIRKGELEESYRAIREPNPFPSVCARVCNHPCESRCRAGDSGGEPIAIRALKRYVTDHVDPSVFKPLKLVKDLKDAPRVAIVGAGPSGLTAAHYLSLKGYRVTVLEAEDQPGGMLTAAIPAYRLPREVLQKEIDSILDENVELKCNTALGRDFTVDSLLGDGYKAVYLALGAHKSRRLGLENEDLKGVYPSIEFLKAFNLRGENSAKGHVGVIGGGNSAIDSARVALRQKGVKSVTVLYRRTRREMPAFAEEIDAAIEEGVKLETLVTPTKILSKNGRFKGLECLKNELGDYDSSGRRRPVPIEGSKHEVALDTLIVAISESSDLSGAWKKDEFRLETVNDDRLVVDKKTLLTNRPGVFAGGDVITGPSTVVDAIAAGKKAAVMIDRYLKGEELVRPAEPRIPKIYIEPEKADEKEDADESRAKQPHISLKARRSGFDEVELSFSQEDATREAGRCLRCDLEFTKPKQDENEQTTRKAN